MELKRDTFARTPLFSGLSPEERDAIAHLAVEQRFAAGETLFSEGEPCKGLHVIGSGLVKITKISPAGREIMLAMESPPSSVAEVPLFDDGPYPATVVAIQDTVAFLLGKEQFRRFCESHPKVPMKVLAVVGRRLRGLVGLVEMVTFGSMRQRLARTLLELSPQSEDSPITHEELAMRLGTVREVVSRNLSRFQAEGMIRIVKRKIEVMNAEALEAEAGAEY